MNLTQQIQAALGFASPGGVWGPKSQAALNKQIAATNGMGSATLRSLQTIIGTIQSGSWDHDSQLRLLEIVNGAWFSCEAPTFADPADVRRFKACKQSGKTDLQCFAVGDNGIGQFGKVTAQDSVPMVAIHKTAMIAKWGSVTGAAHRPVLIVLNGQTIHATVEDRISAPGRVDCNPAVAKQAHLVPPFTKPCQWKWIV